jgi:hypothetical protein
MGEKKSSKLFFFCFFTPFLRGAQRSLVALSLSLCLSLSLSLSASAYPLIFFFFSSSEKLSLGHVIRRGK